MNAEVRGLATQCGRALQDYLAGRGEVALQQAYELGRQALAKGLGVLDMVTIQHRALLTCLLKVQTAKEGSRTLRAANRLFVESLLPFEMSHRRVQETNAALLESEQRYRNLVETARDVIYTLSTDGKIKSLNPVFETITGWSRAEWIGKEFPPLVHPDDLPRAMELYQVVLEGKVPPMFELRILSKSGAYIPGEFQATSLVQDAQIVGVLGVARDITDRKRAEEALRRLNEALEEEIKRIAHALHDEAGQLLASVHIVLAEIVLDLPPHASRRLEDVRGLLTKIEEQLRHMSHELRPTILDDLGLRPAVEFLADGVSRRTGLVISVEGSPGKRLPSPTETALYRIVQEALTNVTRHAQATRVVIRFVREGLLLRCSVRDDGAGFDGPAVQARRGSRGLGLLGIQERLNAVGGTLNIISTPSSGTELIVSVPVEAGGADADSPRR
ncbi:MAG: PAS domain S-box protein [Candidatus Rokubacteria bacterium]|nr:PAS domain S-box protein [Candidatus Rokubacteria bacterium]